MKSGLRRAKVSLCGFLCGFTALGEYPPLQPPNPLNPSRIRFALSGARRPRMDNTGRTGSAGDYRGWVGAPPQKEYSYFTRFARTEFNLPKANFTREAYLTAEGDFTAASAAWCGWGFPRKRRGRGDIRRCNSWGCPPLQPPNPLNPSQSRCTLFGARLADAR